MLSQKRLREIMWEVGQEFPAALTDDYISLFMVHPRLGHVHWNILSEGGGGLREQMGNAFAGAPLIVRVCDVTDILFDGSNAHYYFDLPISGLRGNYYFGIERSGRDYLAEAGIIRRDGSFYSLVRSNTVFFDRDRPTGNYRVNGLFVGGHLNRVFSVENIFDAPIYERVNRELAGLVEGGELSVAVLFSGFDEKTGPESPLGVFVRAVAGKMEQFGGRACLFAAELPTAGQTGSLLETVDNNAGAVCRKVIAAHARKPFRIIHCHDWYSCGAGMAAASSLKLPLMISLHSTEHERAHGNRMSGLSAAIFEREKEAVLAASLVVVPHSSTRQQLISLYGAEEDKVVIVPDAYGQDRAEMLPSVSEVKRLFGVPPDAPVVLFAGEVSHASGADLLADALPTVCRNHRTVHFIMAGDGPLKGELESRVWRTGLGSRCRFLGDVSSDTFDAVLSASEFVVIPARTWQDEGLAQTALSFGKPVLSTHQSGIKCVIHGQNGLVTFDNPGSMVWGIQELLFNPLKSDVLRLASKRRASSAPSIETIAAQYFMHYEMVLGRGCCEGA